MCKPRGNVEYPCNYCDSFGIVHGEGFIYSCTHDCPCDRCEKIRRDNEIRKADELRMMQDQSPFLGRVFPKC